jgi:4-amino-4-deoxy-L-arabinose transferase-like glycosyltransferase
VRHLEGKQYAALTALGLTLRVVASGRGAVIARDGITYLEAAGAFARGDWGAGLAHHYPPLYPLLTCLVSGLGPGLGERAACLAGALASALAVPAAACLAARAGGRDAGLLAGLLAAVSPMLVWLSGEALADGLYLGLILAGLASAQVALERESGSAAWLAPAGSGLVLGLAYLARPEALAVLGAVGLTFLLAPRSAGWPRRFRDLALLGAPALAAGLPYLVWIQEHAVLGGTGAGAFKLTLKRSLGERLGELCPGLVGRRLVEQGWWTIKALGLSLPGLAFAARGARRAAPAARRLMVLLGTSVAALLVCYLLVRTDRRYGVHLATLLAPLAGCGTALLVAACAGDARGRARARLAVALVLVCCAPFAFHTRHRSKASYRLAGVVVREAGVERVLAADPRAAFYGGATPLHLLHLEPDAAARDDPARLTDLARETGATAVVVRVASREQALRWAVMGDLGWEERRAQAPGGEDLRVFLRRHQVGSSR